MRIDKEIKKEYIDKTRKALARELGFKISSDESIRSNNDLNDSFIAQIGRHKIPVAIEVKASVNHMSQVKNFLDFTAIISGVGILTAYSIKDSVKSKLKETGVGFYEIDKELFFPLNLNLSGHGESQNHFVKLRGHRAESNIKMLVYFMSKPEALCYTQRDLAEKLDLSLGSVNNALKNLEFGRIIVTRGKERLFGDIDDIIERWSYSFPLIGKKDQFLGRFSPVDDVFYNRRERRLVGLDSYWGGEPAAAIRTKYLSPEVFTIYTYNDRITPLIKELRLRKDPNGPVSIMKCFWPEEINNEDGTVPDFITICELLNSKIDRNIETAQILKEKLVSRLKQYEY
jgi:hypothetical protein